MSYNSLRASEKGYKNLSGRIGKLERNLNEISDDLKNQNRTRNPSELEFPMMLGDQDLPEENHDESEQKLSQTAPSKSQRSKAKSRANNLNQTAPPRSDQPKKDYSGFREFRKKAQQKANEVSQLDGKPAVEPEIQFVYKNEKGSVASAQVVAGSPVDFSRQVATSQPQQQLTQQVSIFSSLYNFS